MTAPAVPNHEGTVLLAHSGQDVPLRFTWKVFHDLQQAHGLDGWMEHVAQGLDGLDMDVLRSLMVHCAGVDSERAAILCVPVLPAKQALLNAWTVGMTGNVPPEEEQDVGKLMPQPILWGLLSKLRFGQGSHTTGSGASPRTPPASSSEHTQPIGTP